MSQRLQIVIPEMVATQLAELAAAAGEPVARLASRFVRAGVERSADNEQANAPAATSRATETADRRPPWLEPYGGDQQWRGETWGAIVALHARYPRQLQHLKDGWWKDEATTETLAALAVWRSEIDRSGRDPREELAFHHQLVGYADALRREGGSVTDAWQPGPPPPEWNDDRWP